MVPSIHVEKSRYEGRGATYERDEFGRTINLVEAGGVGGIARPAPRPPISGRGGYVNWFQSVSQSVISRSRPA